MTCKQGKNESASRRTSQPQIWSNLWCCHRQPFGAATAHAVLADTLCAVLADTTQIACRRYTSLSGRFADALLADAIYCLLTLYTVLVDATQDSLGGLPTLHKTLCLRTLLFADALHGLPTLHKTLCAVLADATQHSLRCLLTLQKTLCDVSAGAAQIHNTLLQRKAA